MNIADSFFVIGLYVDASAWAGALIEYLSTERKIILHDLKFSQNYATDEFEQRLKAFEKIAHQFDSYVKLICINHIDYQFLFSKKLSHVRVKVSEKFNPLTSPVKLRVGLADGILVTASEEIKRDLITEFKEIAVLGTVSYRIFASCLASEDYLISLISKPVKNCYQINQYMIPGIS